LNKILAVSIGGLGDTILFSPLLKALRKSYPCAHIELLVSNILAKETYSNAKEVSHVTYVDFNSSSPLLKATALIPFLFNTRLNGKFDIGYFATGLNPKFGRLIKIVGAIRDIAFAPSVPNFPTDFDCNLELARSVNDRIDEQDIFIPEIKEAELEAGKILKENSLTFEGEKLIAVYPSNELVHRPRWELSKLIKVIQLIKNDGFKGKIVVVGSKNEGLEWAAIDKDNIADANLAGKLSILGSAEVLKKCSLTLGNDGGLMHVAGAVASPMVTIMANTPSSYRPPGNKVKMIQSNLNCCRGTYPNRPKECDLAYCAEDITVEEVFKACMEILETTGPNLETG
jgi:ADP-heptose:LPS heptosyltransferase